MRISNRIWALIAFIVFIAATVFIFDDLIFHANRRVVSLGGDGCKNMFSYLYHVMYGHGMWFQGMNYPFGEHIIFTDGTPLLAVPLAWLNQSLHLSTGSIMAIMFYCMALSFVLAMWYVYKALVHFKVHPALSIAAAVLTLCLSPQIFRITGHFALSYSCIMPMLFYWTIMYYETGKAKYPVYVYLLCVLAAFTHMYFLGMSLLWMLGYAAGCILLRKEAFKARLKHVLWYALPVVLAFVTVQTVIRLTDPVHDRPVYPLSSPGSRPLMEFATSINSPIWKALKEAHILEGVNENMESTIYAGLAMLAMIGVGVLFGCQRLLKKGKNDLPAFPFQPIWIFIAITTLGFAIGISTIWDIGIFKSLLKPLRQFRAAERFSWIFYYVMSVYAVVVLQQLINRLAGNGKKVLAGIVTVLVLAVWAVDASGYIHYLRKDAGSWEWSSDYFFSRTEKNWTTFLKEQGKSASDFEAMLVIPFVHVGSEKIWYGENESYALSMAYMMATELHMPIMDVMASRTSWQQTFDQVKIEGGIYVRKPILESLKTHKPILLMHYEEYKLSPDMDCLFKASDKIGSQRGCALYAFYPERLFAAQQQASDEIAAMLPALKTADTMVHSAAPYFLEHFDGHASGSSFAGAGLLPAITGEDSIIANWNIPSVVDSMQYECSLWTKLSDQGPQQNSYTLIFKDGGNKELGRADVLTKSSADNAAGFWFRSNKFFVFPAGTRKVSVKAVNYNREAYLASDELQIKPVNGIVLSKYSDGRVLVNNHDFEHRK